MPAPKPTLKYVTLSDFSLGIWSQTRYLGNSTNPAPAQNGAAQVDDTFGCVALPGGGLGPLPGLASVQDIPSGELDSTAVTQIVGMIMGAPVWNNQPEVVFGIEYTGGTDGHQFRLISYLDGAHTFTELYAQSTDFASDVCHTLTGGWTRQTLPGAGTPPVPPAPTWPLPLMALSWYFDSSATPPYGILNWVYPDPTTPGTYAVYHWDATVPAFCFTHEGRVCLIENGVYLWVGTVSGMQTRFFSDEAFFVTDPPGNLALQTGLFPGPQIFLPEAPFGAGAWGILGSGELVIIKNNGGGYVVNGDMIAPSSITYLKGVTPTNYAIGEAISTMAGLIYCSKDRGVWAWNGGETSTKLSYQLDDNAWYIPPVYGQIGNDWAVCTYGDWVLISNNWLYDCLTNSWWRFEDPSVVQLKYFGASIADPFSTIYGMPCVIPAGETAGIYQYAVQTPRNSFSWQGYPILESVDRNLLVREVIVRAQGVGTVTVTLQGIAASASVSSPTTLTFNTDTQPQLLRQVVGGGGVPTFVAADVTVKIVSTGTGGGPAPIVYQVQVGYEETAALASPT